MSQQFSRETLFYFFTSALIFSTIFQDFFHLSFLGGKLQLTELLFLPTLLFFPFQKIRKPVIDNSAKWIFLAIAAYLLINIISSLISGSRPSLIESMARIYLALLFLILIVFFNGLSKEEFKKYISSLFFNMGWFVAIFSLSGYLLFFLGIENNLIIRLDEYPYLGTVYRLRGPTFTPTMLATILAPCIFLSLANYEELPFRKRFRLVLFLLMLIAAFLTFSKSFLIIAWGLFLWRIWKKGKLQLAVVLLTLIPLTVFLFIATHFVFAKKGSPAYERYMQTTFVSDQAAFRIGEWQALETSYYLNKKIALDLVQTNPLIGIGTGNFNSVVDEYKIKGKYPQRFFSYDPHSTWLGTLAENGVLGFIAVSVFLFLLFSPYLKFKKTGKDDTAFAIFLIFCFFLIEGVATDILNFRHFWVFLALGFVYCRRLILSDSFK